MCAPVSVINARIARSVLIAKLSEFLTKVGPKTDTNWLCAMHITVKI